MLNRVGWCYRPADVVVSRQRGAGDHVARSPAPVFPRNARTKPETVNTVEAEPNSSLGLLCAYAPGATASVSPVAARRHIRQEARRFPLRGRPV
jgi:hypothetical protein